MKNFRNTYFSFCTFALLVSAASFAGQEIYYDTSDRAASTCCDYDPCLALQCGEFDAQIHAGFSPVVWRDRSDVFFVDTMASGGPVLRINEIPQFNALYNMPWVIGGQVGYAWTDYVRFFAETTYTQANERSTSKTQFASEDDNFASVNLDLDKYQVVDFHVGSRWYSNDIICNWFSVFGGAKVGVTHHRKVDFAMTAIDDSDNELSLIPSDSKERLFKSSTSISGGLHAGLDVCFWCSWHFVFTSELVANCGPRANNHNIDVSDQGFMVTNVFVSDVETELRFPITAAIRYSF